MKATLTRKVYFNSAHRLHNPNWSIERNKDVFGKCNNPNFHGHNYELEVRVKGEVDPESGYVMDSKLLNALLEKKIIERFDHKNLNLDTEEFRNLNPTTENMARVIYDLVLPLIGTEQQLTIILHETERNSIEYSGE